VLIDANVAIDDLEGRIASLKKRIRESKTHEKELVE
jgi:hypothetical protein